MSFQNIPQELKTLRQWVVWRLEIREGAEKPTKVPYAPRPWGGKAKVTDSATWGSFDEACSAPLTCLEPCDPLLPVDQTGFSGIGFVFTEDDPYGFIDLDDTHGDKDAYNRQLKVFAEFNSYSELSPSGTGLHIIVKGKLPHGRRRADIEIYTSERYATFTGNVQLNAPIEDRHALLRLLFDQMGGEAARTYEVNEKPQTQSDDDIIAMAANAANGDTFKKLFEGNWEHDYGSHSEADQALTNIIVYYTKNFAQIARIFRRSALGQRDKAQRDAYIGYNIRKAFDRELPEVDIEGLRIQFENMLQAKRTAAEPGGTAAVPGIDPGPTPGDASRHGMGPGGATVNPFPPGLLGQVAQFILDAAPRPVPQIALAGAIGLMSAICGRSYNVSGQGLNQYVLMLAPTGTGKDAIASGVSKLMAAVQMSVPAAADFRGPGELVSSAGLIKWLDRKPAVLSILGEFGVKLKEMASPTATAHVAGLERVLLQLYSKSGKNERFDPMAYSDKEKNTAPIISPALTILGESVPERFYSMLDEAMIASGLLPRFMLFEYKGKRPYLREGTENVVPSFALVQTVADLAAGALTLGHNGNVQNVELNEAAKVIFRDFEKWTTDQINLAQTENIRHLWNRAHLKSLKLAAICAVGLNMHAPVITENEAMWAINLIVEQTNRLVAKFEAGNVGNHMVSENRQLIDLVKVVSTYLNEPFERFEKYGGTPEMHRAGVIIETHISRRLMCMASFKHDRLGANAAIKRTLKMLVDGDEIREVPKAQMQATYGKGPRAFVVANPALFAPKVGEDDD